MRPGDHARPRVTPTDVRQSAAAYGPQHGGRIRGIIGPGVPIDPVVTASSSTMGSPDDAVQEPARRLVPPASRSWTPVGESRPGSRL